MRLDDYKTQIYSCLRCGFCFDHSQGGQQKICPPYNTFGLESYGARGKLAIARALVDRVVGYDNEIAARIFACTECSACQEQCLKYVALDDIYAAMKEDLVEKGLLPSKVAEILASLEEFGNPYRKPAEKRFAWLPGEKKVNKKAKVFLFVGCTPAYLRRGIARSAYQVLEGMGVNFTISTDEHCCGHPYLSVGKIKETREAAEKNVEAIKRLGAEKVVVACPGCLRTFKQNFSELIDRPLPFEVHHISEFVVQQLAQRSIRLQKNSRIVTYHDPCNLGRRLGIYEPPRRLIELIPGIRLLEMDRNREDAFCCGNGGFVRYDYEEMSVETETVRFTEAEQSGADALISACPACQTGFLDAKSKTASKVEVLDIVELFATAL